MNVLNVSVENETNEVAIEVDTTINVSVATSGVQGPPGPPLSNRSVCINPFSSQETVVTGDGTVGFCVPSAMNALQLVEAIASVYTPGDGAGTVDIQIRKRRSGSPVDVLSTKITLEAGEYFSSNGVIDTDNDDTETGDMFFIDVDAVTDTKPIGLAVTLTFD